MVKPSLVSKPLTDRTYVSTNMAFKPRDNWLLLTAKPTTSIQIQVTSGLIVHLALNGTVYNFDNNGVVTTKADQTTHQNQFVKGTDQEWYYYDANGKKVTGFQTINKDLYYFNNKGTNKFEEVFST